MTKGGIVRRSRRQAGESVTPIVDMKISKRPKTKSIAKVVVEADSEVVESVRRDKGQTNIGTEGEDQTDVREVMDEIPEDVEKETTECEAVIEEVEEEDQEELHVQSEAVEEELYVQSEEVEEATQAAGASREPGSLPSSEEVQPQQSNSTSKRRRGLTRMRKVAKDPLSKVEVEFTSLGEHAGDGSITLSSFLGPLVREHVPVLLNDWRKLDDQTKDTMWDEIQVYYI